MATGKHHWVIALICLALAYDATARAAEPGDVEFNRDVRPILSDNCFACHGPDEGQREADLRLDVEEIATADRGGYRAVTPGKPDESELIARITSSDEDVRMPPPDFGKSLSTDQVQTLRNWIEHGAVYQEHWSRIPPKRPAVPAVKDAAWPRGDIDHFILARLESEGVAPSPEADKVTLVRRLHFDLTGLPPTRDEVDRFVDGEETYEQRVDRLLASPHYGERMAIYWLDLVRYADTVGYHGDQEHAISPYRDYVINAFNVNMPIDQFTLEQLAGDLLPDATVDQKIASGYNRVLQTSHEGGVQVEEYLKKYDADRIRNLSSVWLGTTMGCCECHDHKFDPITQKDFYSLVAFFADVQDRKTFNGGDSTPTRREPEIEVLSPIDRARIAEIESELARLEDAVAKRTAEPTPAAESDATGPPADSSDAASGGEATLSDLDRIATLKQQIETLGKQTRRTMVTVSAEPRTIRVLNRGDWMDESGEIVSPAVPAVLEQINVDGRPTRVDLAKWLTRADHPLTSRVFVNRLWYLFFGVGLSNTLDDFGSQGEWPTHPELLDWLAVEFVESGWDVKHIVKLLVMSQTYRQSSLTSEELGQRDPDNRMFARQSRFRLPAEMIRDNALAASGLLVDRLGGYSARPYQPKGYYAHLNFPKREYHADTDDNQYRRGVYIHWQRQFLHPMLKAFDAPSREECTTKRPESNTPLAALVLLNDPTFLESARVFAARIIREGGETDMERIAWAWQTVLSREPDERETAALEDLYQDTCRVFETNQDAARELVGIGLADQPEDIPVDELAAWTVVARAIFNLNETITRN